jgi:hypothetical protein
MRPVCRHLWPLDRLVVDVVVLLEPSRLEHPSRLRRWFGRRATRPIETGPFARPGHVVPPHSDRLRDLQSSYRLSMLSRRPPAAITSRRRRSLLLSAARDLDRGVETHQIR